MTLYSNELYHHGVLGQKWGIRRYQNKDGSLTAAGRKRYSGLTGKVRYIKDKRTYNKTKKELAKAREIRAKKAELKKEWAKDPETMRKHLNEFTDKEIQDALVKFNADRQLADLQAAKINRGLTYANNGVMLATNIAKLAQEVSKVDLGKAQAENMKATAKQTEAKAKQEEEKAAQAELQTKIDKAGFDKFSKDRKAEIKKEKQQEREEALNKMKDRLNKTKESFNKAKEKMTSNKAKDSGDDDDKGSKKSSRETIEPEIIDPPGSSSSSGRSSSSNKSSGVFDAEYTEHEIHSRKQLTYSPKLLTYKDKSVNDVPPPSESAKKSFNDFINDNNTQFNSANDTYKDIEDWTKKNLGL